MKKSIMGLFVFGLVSLFTACMVSRDIQDRSVQNVIILGSGPAGLTAGIYAARAGFKPLIIDGNQPGGQLTTTSYVENWPGDIRIMGPELMTRIREHAKHYGAEFLSESVQKVDFSKQPYTVTMESGKTLEARSVIIATGASHKKLHVPGEDEYLGKGVSTCATCDAPFYQEKP